MKDAEVAAALDVTTAQAKAWLQRLADEGVIEKQKKPAGYILKQSSLFEAPDHTHANQIERRVTR